MYTVDDAVWAVNPKKVSRAILALQEDAKEVTEEAVKELYIKYGGAVLGEPDTFRGFDEKGPSPIVAQIIEEKTAKAKSKKK